LPLCENYPTQAQRLGLNGAPVSFGDNPIPKYNWIPRLSRAWFS
jgi:hypothetical protein